MTTETLRDAINKLNPEQRIEFEKELGKESSVKLNYFKGVPMKVICDYLTTALIDEFNLDLQFRDVVDAQMFRSKIDQALWKTVQQTENGKWNSDSVK